MAFKLMELWVHRDMIIPKLVLRLTMIFITNNPCWEKKMNSPPISEVLTLVQSMNEDIILLISEDIKPQTGEVLYSHLILSYLSVY